MKAGCFEPSDIRTERIIRCYHSGDLGDIIYSLLFCKSLGKIALSLGPNSEKGVREAMTLKRFNWLAPLLRSQPWIVSSEFANDVKGIDYNLNDFRKTWFSGNSGHRIKRRLFETYAEHFRRPRLPEDKPWLTVEPIADPQRPVIIARSSRYRWLPFPWPDVARRYAGQMRFVGYESEYKEWIGTYGATAEYAPVNDALELARLIAGAELFIGNQSFPMSLALALNVPLIQETCMGTPDCVFNRKNATYSHMGPIRLPTLRNRPGAIKLALPCVTLVAIDSFKPMRTLRAMMAAKEQATFADSVLVTHAAAKVPEQWVSLLPALPSDVRIERERYMITRITEAFSTGHCLNIEWDAGIKNPEAWNPEWLKFDFIGAPWRHGNKMPGFPMITKDNCVGNTGFSLMSKRFANALAEISTPTDYELGRASDTYICTTLRPKLEAMGLQFAPEIVAARFSCEDRQYTGQFGWHGKGTAKLNGFKLDYS